MNSQPDGPAKETRMSTPTAPLLRSIVQQSNCISNRELDQLTEVELIQLEMRLIEWQKAVTSELCWRSYNRKRSAA